MAVLNIVLCTHRFLPRFKGGVEVYTLHLARALQGFGHQVSILTGEPIPKTDDTLEVVEDEYEGISLIRLKYDYLRQPVTFRAGYSAPNITTHIKAILQKLVPDIVHATSLSLLMGGTIGAASSLGIPTIYTATDFVLTCRRGTYLKWDNTICNEKEEIDLCTVCMEPHAQLEIWLDRVWRMAPKRLAQTMLASVENLVDKRADFVYAAASIEHRFNYLPHWMQKIEQIIAPSTHMRDMLALNNFPPERIIISPYGVELPQPNFKKMPSAKLRFGFIGRLTFIKGIHLLLEAFALLPEPERAQLTIYGSADVKSKQYAQTLQNKAAQHPNINFAKFIDNANISQIYSRLDVLVVPSVWPENSPITILEAQAHGVPIIASDVKGIADLVQHEVNGLIFATHNIHDLVRQMARCLASPELVSSLACHSQPVKSIQQDVKNMVSLYEEIVATKV